jgi:hypothetical protein
VLCRRAGGILACVTLINIGDLNRLSGFNLYPCSKLEDLGVILLISGRDTQSEQVPQSVDREMNVIVFAAFCSVLAGTPPALNDRL